MSHNENNDTGYVSRDHRVRNPPPHLVDYDLSNRKAKALEATNNNKDMKNTTQTIESNETDTIPKILADNAVTELQHQIEQLKKKQQEETDQLKDTIQQIQSQCAQKDQEMKTLRDDLERLSAMYDENKGKMQKLHNEHETLKTKYASLGTENTSNKRRVKQLEETNGKLQKRIIELKKQNTTQEVLLETYIQRNDDLKAKIESTQADNNQTTQHHKQEATDEQRNRRNEEERTQNTAKPTARVNKICRFALRGKCRFDSHQCAYIHPVAERSSSGQPRPSLICSRYNSEQGCNTTNCKFVHMYKRDESCRHFNSITGCKFGRYCMYHHINEPNHHHIQPGVWREQSTNKPQPKNEQAFKLDQLLESMAKLTQLMAVTASQQAHNRMQNGYRQAEIHAHQHVPTPQQHYNYQQQANNRPNPMQHSRPHYT